MLNKILGCVIMGAGGILLGWQCLSYSCVWLQHGDAVWPDFSLYVLMAPRISWLTSPQEWIGIHKIVSACLKFVGLAFILLVVGWGCFVGEDDDKGDGLAEASVE